MSYYILKFKDSGDVVGVVTSIENVSLDNDETIHYTLCNWYHHQSSLWIVQDEDIAQAVADHNGPDWAEEYENPCNPFAGQLTVVRLEEAI